MDWDSIWSLFSLSFPAQDDKDLVHEFVVAEGLTCLIKVGAEADQNYQNYILRGKFWCACCKGALALLPETSILRALKKTWITE